jgi:hypothetical protein
LIDTITTSNFYLKFKENNENDMTFCYFSCLGQYCFLPTSMAAVSSSALAGWLTSFKKKGWKSVLILEVLFSEI